jgi:predicted transcriptional regulator
MKRCMGTGNSISLPEELLAGIKSAAEAEHRSVDDVLAEAIQRYLDDQSWTKAVGLWCREGEGSWNSRVRYRPAHSRITS